MQKRSNVIEWFILVAVISAIAVIIGFAAYLQDKAYDQMTYDNCKQYEVLPESQVDRIPDGCIAQYYKDR